MASLTPWLPWLALGVAFSPVLVDLGAHLVANPWARYALWFPLLLARCVAARRDVAPARHGGTFLLVVGLGLEVFGMLAGTTRLGRLGLVLGTFGVGLHFGFARARTLLLAAFAIPVPAAVMRVLSPALPEALLAAAVVIARGLGVDAAREGHRVVVGERGLSVDFSDSALPLAALLVGLSWYHSERAALPWRRALARAAGWGMLAVPLQVTILTCALLGLALGLGAAGDWPAHAGWLVVAPAGIAAAELASRAARRPA